MSTRHTDDTDDERAPKERYQKVRGIIDGNTGGMQRPSVSVRGVGVVAGHAGLDMTAVRKALRALEANGEILAWRDREGRKRVCLTDRETLAAVRAHERAREHPNEALAEHCLDLLEGDDA